MNAINYSLLTERFALNRAIALLKEILTQLATQENLRLRVQQLFGNRCNANYLERFCQQWGDRCFQSLPPIEICPCEEINAANALFSSSDRCIYIAQEYLSWQSKHPDAIATVLLDAIGHFLSAEMHLEPASWHSITHRR